MSLSTHGVTLSFFDHISGFFVDRYGRSLRLCHLEFATEAISEGCNGENARYPWEVFEDQVILES